MWIWLQQLAISIDALLKYAVALSPTCEIGVLGFLRSRNLNMQPDL